MSVPNRDADENGLRLELYLSSKSLFSGEMPSRYVCRNTDLSAAPVFCQTGGSCAFALSIK